MSFRRLKFVSLICLLISIISATASSDKGHETIKKIVIVTSSSRSDHTVDHLTGIVDGISQIDTSITIDYFNVENTRTFKQEIWSTIHELDADLIITNGTRLGYSVLQQKMDTPLILSGFMGTDILQFHSNTDVGVVSYDYSYKVYLSAIQQAFPWAKKVGIGYSPDHVSLFSAADSVATDMGMELISFEAKDTKDILLKVESILPFVDIYYCIPWFYSFALHVEEGAMEQKNLTLYKHSIPYTTIHPVAINMGACFILLPDYYEIGRLTGELVSKRIEEGPSDKPVIEKPQNYQIIINESMSARLGIKYPDDFLKKAVIIRKTTSQNLAGKP